MSQQYEPLSITNGRPVLYTCNACGSLVHNMARHDGWHRAYETHGHAYAACYGPGGEWDRTAGPVTAKSAGPGAVGVTGEAEK